MDQAHQGSGPVIQSAHALPPETDHHRFSSHRVSHLFPLFSRFPPSYFLSLRGRLGLGLGSGLLLSMANSSDQASAWKQELGEEDKRMAKTLMPDRAISCHIPTNASKSRTKTKTDYETFKSSLRPRRFEELKDGEGLPYNGSLITKYSSFSVECQKEKAI
ncbi:uncharacterized [Tachysurus ichikawai]